MPALHVLATLLLAPYVALAILLLAFGHATSRGSLWGFLDAVLNHALWIIPWGGDDWAGGLSSSFAPPPSPSSSSGGGGGFSGGGGGSFGGGGGGAW